MHKRVACSLGSFGSLPSHKSLIKADSSLRSRYSCWHQMKTRESVFIIRVSLNCGSSCYDNAVTNINVYLFKINHALWSVPSILSEVSTIQKQNATWQHLFLASVWQAADRQPRRQKLAVYSLWAAAGPGSVFVTSLLFAINSPLFPPQNIQQTAG